MTTDPRTSAIIAADTMLAEHTELLERFIAAASSAGVIPALSAEAEGRSPALSRGRLVSLLKTFDPSLPLRIRFNGNGGGRTGTPAHFRFTAWRGDGIAAHYYVPGSYLVSVGDYAAEINGLDMVAHDSGETFTVNDSSPFRLSDDGLHPTRPDSWIITGAEEYEGAVWLAAEEEIQA